jgi:hypothetical protein
MRTLIVSIAKTLSGIAYDDLTTAERKIADLLIRHSYLLRDGNNLSLPK